MRKTILAALVAAVAYCGAIAEASAQKIAAICTGMFGEMVAPMLDYDAPLKAKGYKVIRISHRYLPPDLKPDIVISHSACADTAPAAYPKAKHYPLDGTWLGRGCPKGTVCDNYYAPVNMLPFLVCCGGYPTRGSTKVTKEVGTPWFILVHPGHVGLPSKVRDRVMRSIK